MTFNTACRGCRPKHRCFPERHVAKLEGGVKALHSDSKTNSSVSRGRGSAGGSSSTRNCGIGVSMANRLEDSVSVLAIGEFGSDRMLLHDVVRRAGWRLLEASDRRRALRFLERMPVHVVLAESDLPNWDWKKVLHDLRRLAQPPQLVVTSRTADDYLWAEVLNIGGYDVLPQPLERDELERVVAAARRQYCRMPAQSAPVIAPAASVA